MSSTSSEQSLLRSLQPVQAASIETLADQRAHCSTTLDIKKIHADGTFEGYACLFGNEDLGHDVVMPGAFRESIERRGTSGIKMLFQHDPAQPIGVWLDFREDARGLYVKGKLMVGVARAREVLSLMRAGALDGLSIGFKAVKASRDAKSGQRRLEKIDLWEISVVTFPMQPEARVTAVKAGPFADGFPTERQFERWLTRDAGLTRSQARTLIVSGFKTLARKLEAAGGSSEVKQLVDVMSRAAELMDQASKRTL
ncbi:MAG: HK97 family phage prohead protease [Hyphomicrobiaceae bacterium]